MTAITGSVTLDGSIEAHTVPATAPGWELVDAGLATITRRRDAVTSPWVHEDVEVTSVRGALTYRVVLRAVGTDLAEASEMVEAAVDVVEQKTWDLVVDLDGHVETYACRAALTIDLPYDRDLVINARREITITIPVRRA